MKSRWIIAAISIVAILLFDQILKIWVKTHMALGEETFDLGFFHLHYIENNGMAFGTEFGGENGKLALTLFRLVAIVLLGYYLYKLVQKRAHKGLVFSIGLIFAGAMGNIIDSVFYGMFFDTTCPCSPYDDGCIVQNTYCLGGQISEVVGYGDGYASILHGKVVDMFQFTVEWPEWMPYLSGEIFPPIFNVADSAISIGLIIIVLRVRTFFPPQDKKTNRGLKFGFKKRAGSTSDDTVENEIQSTHETSV